MPKQFHIENLLIIKFVRLVKKFSFFKTIYFNVRCLPIRQAMRMPILVTSAVKINRLKGKVTLIPSNMKFGSISIGLSAYGFQKKYDKAILDIMGGELLLAENIYIGKGTFIEVGKVGKLTIGKNTFIGGNSKLICHDDVNIGENTRIAWEVTILDTDFHEYISILTQKKSLAKKPVRIGANNWIGFGTTILKGTTTPNYCIVGAKSFLTKEYQHGEFCLLAGHPAKIVKEGVYRDFNSYVE